MVDAGGNTAGYTTALDNIGIAYDLGTPTSHEFTFYNNIIWVEGSGGPDDGERANLTTFLDGGGNLYINGQDIGYGANLNGWLPWYEEYLNASYVADDTDATVVDGVPGDEITNGMAGFTITGTFPENITVIAPGEAIFTYVNSADTPGALKVDKGTYKLVYIAFQYFEGTDAQANMDQLMYNILFWLDPTLAKPRITHTPLPDTESTTPYTVEATIIDNSLVGADIYWQA
ncbi:MAG: hypothetical protein KAT70_09025, partial [Thermoplasmata archaeon]|nr:hypothetical protein [Thermoplasmata archaeon]